MLDAGLRWIGWEGLVLVTLVRLFSSPLSTERSCSHGIQCSCTLNAGWNVGWDGMGWDGMGWDGMGWDGMGWDGMGTRDGMGWDGMGWDGMGWEHGMGWDGMGWDGMGWDGMGRDEMR